MKEGQGTRHTKNKGQVDRDHVTRMDAGKGTKETGQRKERVR